MINDRIADLFPTGGTRAESIRLATPIERDFPRLAGRVGGWAWHRVRRRRYGCLSTHGTARNADKDG